MNPRTKSQITSRTAAAVWAALALVSAIFTTPLFELPGTDSTLMLWIAASAACCSGATLLVPWARLPRVAFNLTLILMSVYIAVFAHATGAADGWVLTLFTFAVALAACFMPLRAGVAELCGIAIGVTVLVLIVGQAEDTRLEMIRVSMLLATLMVLCGFVLMMRALVDEKRLAMRVRGSFRYGEGLLNEEQLSAAVAAELSRAARHGRPLSLVMFEVTGSLVDQVGMGQQQRIMTAIARGVLSRIRVEDSAAHLGGLRFAVMTPETPLPGAAAVAGIVADMVRRRLISAGYDGGSFDVAVGWADFPGAANNAGELINATRTSLERRDRSLSGDAAGPQATPHPAPGH